MVEAVGIEPTSGSLQQWNLHAYPIFLSSQGAIKTGKSYLPRTSPSTFLNRPLREASPLKSPRIHAPVYPAGRIRGTATLNYAASANCSLAVICFATD